MAKRPISVVIVDLDNTLWDWVNIWYRSFRAELDKIVEISGIPEVDLYQAISAVHRKHHTSEYSFLIAEIEPLIRKHGPGADLVQIYRPAIDAYREARRKALVLYPGVFETLWKFRDLGCLIIGYTESQEFYTNYRMRRLGLDGLLDYVYSPRDHDLPEGLTPDQIRTYREDTYRFKRTEHRYTPPGELKPNPAVLNSILADIGATPDQAIYIGDSEMKDIAMAQDCRVADVFAEYGRADPRQYDLLKAVTHWTAEDVAREARIQARGEITPTYVIQSFAQVLALFDFVRFKPQVDEDDLPHVIDLWKTTVDVQKHFNDIELRIRNFAVMVLVAVIGAAGVLADPGLSRELGLFAAGGLLLGALGAVLITVTGKPSKPRLMSALGAYIAGIVVACVTWRQGPAIIVPLAAIVLGGGMVALAAFFGMDRFWYHKLLMGAVYEGNALEAIIEKRVPTRGLTRRIGDESPVTLGKMQIHSSRKMNWFYGSIFGMFVLLLIGAYVVRPAVSAGPQRHIVTIEQPVESLVKSSAVPAPSDARSQPADPSVRDSLRRDSVTATTRPPRE